MPIPVYASIVAVAMLAPIVANQFSIQQSKQIELLAFSTSITRGVRKSKLQEFDVIADLSTLGGNSAVMIKVTPDVKQVYLLQVYDSSNTEDAPVWVSSPFTVSSRRDQIITLPKSAKVAGARIRVLGKERDGSFTAVRFCHYSETCL